MHLLTLTKTHFELSFKLWIVSQSLHMHKPQNYFEFNPEIYVGLCSAGAKMFIWYLQQYSRGSKNHRSKEGANKKDSGSEKPTQP